MHLLLAALLALHPPFAPADAQQIIPKLATSLEESYVVPETGQRYATLLRANLAAGRYASFPDSGAFAEKVTADLQAVAPDAHLVLVAPRTDRPATTAPSSAPPDQPPPIGKAGWLAPGVAYIEFHSFPSDEKTLANVQDFLDRHSTAKALIIDTVHSHAGGWIGEADLLFSDLFGKPTDLVAIDIRKPIDDRIGGFAPRPSLRKVDAPAGVVRYIHSVPSPKGRLKNAKVYVLISNRTISAGEHLVFALKQSHRATLIGERTRGAGNVSQDVPMPAGYTAVIPFAHSFDPRTGADWERVGVQPDIRVPAEQALARALALAGVKENKPGPTHAASELIGTWRGTSVCTDRVAAPACKDETVVYDFTAGAKPDTVHWKADKIVNGERVNMGEFDLVYSTTDSCWRAELTSPRFHMVWCVKVDGATLTGTATVLPGKQIVRKIEAKKE